TSLTTVSTNQDLTINPNGTGDIYFHSSSYGISDTGDITLGGRLTLENSAYVSNETDGTLELVAPTVLISASSALDIDSPSISLATQATNFDLTNSTVNALSFESSLLSLDTLNTRIGLGTAAPDYFLDIRGNSFSFGATNQNVFATD